MPIKRTNAAVLNLPKDSSFKSALNGMEYDPEAVPAFDQPARDSADQNGMNHPQRRLRIGLFGTGLEAYWPQFRGLKKRLEGYQQTVAGQLRRDGVELVDLGMIDSPAKALGAGHRFREEDVDLIFLYVSTYALSATILPVIQRAKVPVIVLNLQPAAAIDYAAFNRMTDRMAMTGEWLAHCGVCTLPEVANVFQRAGIRFFQVTGTLQPEDRCWDEIDAWIDAAHTVHVMSHNRLGLLGHPYGGMLDIYSDITRQCIVFGGQVEILEVDELAALRRAAAEPQVKARLAEFLKRFEIQPGCPAGELRQAAQTSVALDALVRKHDLGSLAYYYQGTGNRENEQAISSIILGNSLLTARGIPVAGEYEIKNAQAMKIMDSFGAGGSFTEFYAMDFNDDIVLMGHDGPGHIAIAEGKIKVRPLRMYHGKVGNGLSVEMSVKHGPVTLLSVVETEGKLKLVMAEGESVPGPILEIGNTNSRYRFSIGARRFVNDWNQAGPAHHCAVGVGHLVHKLRKFGALLGLECVQVG